MIQLVNLKYSQPPRPIFRVLVSDWLVTISINVYLSILQIWIEPAPNQSPDTQFLHFANNDLPIYSIEYLSQIQEYCNLIPFLVQAEAAPIHQFKSGVNSTISLTKSKLIIIQNIISIMYLITLTFINFSITFETVDKFDMGR